MPSHQPALTLHMHPLSSYCWKVLIALHETATPFHPIEIAGPPHAAPGYAALWPMAKMPLLRHGAVTIPESSIIIEYLATHHPAPAPLIPPDPEAAREVRLWDRIFDLYLHAPMQSCVADRLRPEPARNPAGVAEAHHTLATAYAMLDRRMETRIWAAADTFSMADCAALPPLFYADAILPWRRTHPALAAYFERLLARPSIHRVIEEARPFLPHFPFAAMLDPRFLPPPAS